MRLSAKEKREIPRIFANALSDIPYKLYLFGSRTDDSKRGGDIDLLVIVPADKKPLCLERKSHLKLQLMESIGEQKVDITFATDEEMAQDPFLQSIRPCLMGL